MHCVGEKTQLLVKWPLYLSLTLANIDFNIRLSLIKYIVATSVSFSNHHYHNCSHCCRHEFTVEGAGNITKGKHVIIIFKIIIILQIIIIIIFIFINIIAINSVLTVSVCAQKYTTGSTMLFLDIARTH